MRLLPKFIHAAPEGFGKGVIISTEGTPYVGRIIWYDDYLKMNTALNQAEPLAYSIVPGYCFVIGFHSVLGKGTQFNWGPNGLEEVQRVMEEMAQWYLEHKVVPLAAKLRKYEI